MSEAARDRENLTRDLTLMLMFLNSWRAKGTELPRCWKGYEFDVLDQFAEAELIRARKGAKSAYLTPKGSPTGSYAHRTLPAGKPTCT